MGVVKSYLRVLPLVLAVSFIVSCAAPGKVSGGTPAEVQTYFTIDDMPDLVKCLPAPPAWGSSEFAYDSLRYFWGKEQRTDSLRAAQAKSDAVWTLEALFASFNEAFGMTLSPEETPQIWKLLVTGISTTDLIRVRPQAYFHRLRPFEYFNDHLLDPSEEDELSGEGSYPSGHTIRGWSVALLLAEINPDAAGAIYSRGWDYGESRVIVGAHWQSDVDASRAAASIAYGRLHTSRQFREQMERAKTEYRKKLLSTK